MPESASTPQTNQPDDIPAEQIGGGLLVVSMVLLVAAVATTKWAMLLIRR